jgi:sulfur relay protein TusB/DsrH
MNRILHILKDPDSTKALKLIGLQAANHPENLAILLIQDAVKLTPSIAAKVYVLQEDAEARGVQPPFEGVNYEKMVEMILAADTVMTW